MASAVRSLGSAARADVAEHVEKDRLRGDTVGETVPVVQHVKAVSPRQAIVRSDVRGEIEAPPAHPPHGGAHRVPSRPSARSNRRRAGRVVDDGPRAPLPTIEARRSQASAEITSAHDSPRHTLACERQSEVGRGACRAAPEKESSSSPTRWSSDA